MRAQLSRVELLVKLGQYDEARLQLREGALSKVRMDLAYGQEVYTAITPQASRRRLGSWGVAGEGMDPSRSRGYRAPTRWAASSHVCADVRPGGRRTPPHAIKGMLHGTSAVPGAAQIISTCGPLMRRQGQRTSHDIARSSHMDSPPPGDQSYVQVGRVSTARSARQMSCVRAVSQDVQRSE